MKLGRMPILRIVQLAWADRIAGAPPPPHSVNTYNHPQPHRAVKLFEVLKFFSDSTRNLLEDPLTH